MNALVLILAATLAGTAEIEKAAVLALAPDAAVDVRAVADGEWDSPATWGGVMPKDGDDVLIPAGRIVLIDSLLEARLNTVRVDGVLEFAQTEQSQLLVDTLVVTADGKLELGHVDSPVTGDATIRFIDDGPLSSGLSRGLVSVGMVSIVGAEKPFTGGWAYEVQNGYVPTDDLTRTITFSSESTEVGRRGHVMLMHHGDYLVKWAAFHDLGRTDKSTPISSANLRGRYALHFHRCGFNKAIQCAGVVVKGTVGWGLVNHSSDVAASLCVVYDSFGACFVTEAGDERGSFDNCLAVRANGSGQGHMSRNSISDFGHSGHGFWLQSNQVAVADCEAVDCGSFAYFVFGFPFVEPDTGVRPIANGEFRTLAAFTRNKAHHANGSFWLEGAQNDTAGTAEACEATDCVNGVVIRRAHVDVVGGKFVGRGLNNGSTGISFIHGYRGRGNVTGAYIEGFNKGYAPSSIGTNFIRDCTFSNNREADVAIHANGNANADDNQQITNNLFGVGSRIEITTRPNNQGSLLHQRKWNFFLDGKQIYGPFQHPDFTPPYKNAGKEAKYFGKTNQQIYDEFGEKPLGDLIPAGAVNKGGYWVQP